jgi:hypothetical protein
MIVFIGQNTFRSRSCVNNDLRLPDNFALDLPSNFHHLIHCMLFISAFDLFHDLHLLANNFVSNCDVDLLYLELF